jgi:hypothetical protein
LAEPRRVFDERRSFGEVAHAGQRRAVADRGDRNPEQRSEFDDFSDGPGPEPPSDEFTDPVALVPAAHLETELGVVGELRAVHHRTEVQPLLPGGHRDPDVAVPGGLDRRNLGGAFDGSARHEFLAQPGERLHG